MSTDMRLDRDFQLIPRANGDAELTGDNACFLQTLRMEAAASEGDLWYSPEWGWSLLDFKGALQDDLTALEIEQRIRRKLAAHEEISVESIGVTASWKADSILVEVVFRLLSDAALVRLNQIIGTTKIEVTELA